MKCLWFFGIELKYRFGFSGFGLVWVFVFFKVLVDVFICILSREGLEGYVGGVLGFWGRWKEVGIVGEGFRVS